MKLSEDLDWLFEDVAGDIHALKRGLLNSGQQFIDLSMINPDFTPPQLLQDRLVEASVKPSNHRYSVSRGVRKLRESFAEKYKNSFDVRLDPGTEICVAMGTKDALAKTLRLFPKNIKVLVAEPSYPMHLAAVQLRGLPFDTVRLSREPQIFLNRVREALSRETYSAFLVNFPHNPTGIMFGREDYAQLIEICKASDVAIINDFVYGDITRNGDPACSVLRACEDYSGVVEMYSLSKALSIPGWRVAAVAGDEAIVDRLCRLKQHADYGIFLPLQLAVSSYLGSSGPYVKQVASDYARRAEVLVEGLQEIGWKVSVPSAGASVWAKLPDNAPWADSTRFCVQFLQAQHVALLPGLSFGSGYDRFVRFALVRGEHELREVLARLERMQGDYASSRAIGADARGVV